LVTGWKTGVRIPAPDSYFVETGSAAHRWIYSKDKTAGEWSFWALPLLIQTSSWRGA